MDRAVREMLDVEQPAGLRHRVLRRIENRSTFRRNIWITAPLAAAAVLILAVLAPWRTSAPASAPTAPPQVASNNTPVIAPPVVPPPATGVGPQTPRQPAPRRQPVRAPDAPGVSTGRTIMAAAVADEDTNFTRIAALDGPASIAPRELSEPPPPGLRSIEPAPIVVPALQVTVLPETPQTRREE